MAQNGNGCDRFALSGSQWHDGTQARARLVPPVATNVKELGPYHGRELNPKHILLAR